MIFPSNRVRILVATQPVDFRKGHDGLTALVQSVLRKDALVPDLGGLLVGGDGLGHGAVADTGASEHREDLSERLTTVPPPP